MQEYTKGVSQFVCVVDDFRGQCPKGTKVTYEEFYISFRGDEFSDVGIQVNEDQKRFVMRLPEFKNAFIPTK